MITIIRNTAIFLTVALLFLSLQTKASSICQAAFAPVSFSASETVEIPSGRWAPFAYSYLPEAEGVKSGIKKLKFSVQMPWGIVDYKLDAESFGSEKQRTIRGFDRDQIRDSKPYSERLLAFTNEGERSYLVIGSFDKRIHFLIEIDRVSKRARLIYQQWKRYKDDPAPPKLSSFEIDESLLTS